MAKLMLEKGAEINSEEGGCRGMCQAASHSHTSTVALLLDHGAKAISPRHMKPELLLAARSGTAATVSLLYERGFANQGPQSLFKAVMVDPLDVVGKVSISTLEIQRGDQFCTLLSWASVSNALICTVILHPRLKVLQFLFDNAVDAKAEDSFGQTAKDLAATSNHPEAVDLLETRNT